MSNPQSPEWQKLYKQYTIWAEALNNVWIVICGDILVDEQGKQDLEKTISRDTVFEICCDAHFYTFSGLPKEEVKLFYERDKQYDDQLIYIAFPFENYGWQRR